MDRAAALLIIQAQAMRALKQQPFLRNLKQQHTEQSKSQNWCLSNDAFTHTKTSLTHEYTSNSIDSGVAPTYTAVEDGIMRITDEQDSRGERPGYRKKSNCQCQSLVYPLQNGTKFLPLLTLY